MTWRRRGTLPNCSPPPNSYCTGQGLDHPHTSNWLGQNIRKQGDLAKAQTKYYQNKLNDIKDSIPRVNYDPLKYLKRAFSRWLPVGAMPEFQLREVTVSEVTEMIKTLKNSKDFGRDRIDVAAVKLTPIITHVINLSLGTGNFPRGGNWCGIVPLLK